MGLSCVFPFFMNKRNSGGKKQTEEEQSLCRNYNIYTKMKEIKQLDRFNVHSLVCMCSLCVTVMCVNQDFVFFNILVEV